ncbi:MAG: hypothetical protein JWP91_2534 [Fibrobacteres bacterium]|nr:hypothetical protein [Fibrobacterota bacterium]
MRPYPPPAAHPDALSPAPVYAPLPSPGNAVQFAFTTLEGLVAHFSQWLPPQYVNNLIETEKEIFVVRKECSLQETRLQFLKKCENALQRTLSELQSGQIGADWNLGTQPGR